MLLVLSEDHKEHLSFLPKVDTAVVGEFGRIALEFLRRGSSPKIYEGAARKLCVPVEMVQHGVEGLMYLMTESSKHMISEEDFLDSVLVLGFGEELNQTLLQLASRPIRQQVIPMLTMRLLLTGGCDLSRRVLQTDPSTLLHLISTLEAALAAIKTNHARRIFRNIK
ncbi:COMM domain-containing protein 2 [Liparis tanakae]|uniref:COMM domain-containing protein 2 n=1 Tax=Liparis tanakae TaxID=230148 RepID=A0A4Z2IJH9_9TELE|nr:COMM domain-containing protein 2 [Liparis tanakae]